MTAKLLVILYDMALICLWDYPFSTGAKLSKQTLLLHDQHNNV